MTSASTTTIRPWRWIITSLDDFQTTYRPDPVFLGVSQTTDPRGLWNIYQVPACGPADTVDLADQPHTGFNSYWIVVNSLCNAGNNGYSLQVLDKANLYNNGSISLGTNWWEFQDRAASDDGRQDNPVATYTSKTNLEYLTHAQISSSNTPQIVYSYVGGSEFSPSPSWDVGSVTVAGDHVAAGGLATVISPGCTGCVYPDNIGNAIQSSSVMQLPGFSVWLLSSSVWQFPTYANTNLSTYVASNLTKHTALAANIGDQPGVGMMAAAIGAPSASGIPGVTDPVFILWSSTANNFYPGIQYYVWDVSKNTLPSSGSWGGTQNPSGCTTSNPCRWVDFIDLAKWASGAEAGTDLLGGPVSYSQPQTQKIVTFK